MTLCEAHNYTSEFSVKDSECGVGQDQMVTLTQLLANWVIFKKKKKNSIYLFLAVLGLHCRSSFPLVMATGGYSSYGVQASFVSAVSRAQGLQWLQHMGFSSCGSWALETALTKEACTP